MNIKLTAGLFAGLLEGLTDGDLNTGSSFGTEDKPQENYRSIENAPNDQVRTQRMVATIRRIDRRVVRAENNLKNIRRSFDKTQKDLERRLNRRDAAAEFTNTKKANIRTPIRKNKSGLDGLLTGAGVGLGAAAAGGIMGSILRALPKIAARAGLLGAIGYAGYKMFEFFKKDRDAWQARMEKNQGQFWRDQIENTKKRFDESADKKIADAVKKMKQQNVPTEVIKDKARDAINEKNAVKSPVQRDVESAATKARREHRKKETSRERIIRERKEHLEKKQQEENKNNIISEVKSAVEVKKPTVTMTKIVDDENSLPERNPVRTHRAAIRLDDTPAKHEDFRKRAEFLKFGKLPRGFEHIAGNQGLLGKPGAVAARGAQPFGGMSGGGSNYAVPSGGSSFNMGRSAGIGQGQTFTSAQKPSDFQSGQKNAIPAEAYKNFGDGSIRVDSKGNVDKQQYYNAAVKRFASSPLNGFVPEDGYKYGITKGSPEEWANLAMRLTKVESNFNVNVTNMADPGGSRGLMQWGNHHGINNSNWRDPNAQLDALVSAADMWVVKGGGYINPPKGIKAKRYHGWGGLSSMFSTVRNNKVNRGNVFDVGNRLASNAPKRIEDPKEKTGAALPKVSSPQHQIKKIQREAETLLNKEDEIFKQETDEDQFNLKKQRQEAPEITKFQEQAASNVSSAENRLRNTELSNRLLGTGDFGIEYRTRRQMRQQGERYGNRPGKRSIFLDFNAPAAGTRAKGFLMVIPDNASPAEIKSYQSYRDGYINLMRKYGGSTKLHGRGRHGRGLLTTRENRNGVPGTVHLEDGFNTDPNFRRLMGNKDFINDLARLRSKTLGSIPGVTFQTPHGSSNGGRDQGAVMRIKDPETGELKKISELQHAKRFGLPALEAARSEMRVNAARAAKGELDPNSQFYARDRLQQMRDQEAKQKQELTGDKVQVKPKDVPKPQLADPAKAAILGMGDTEVKAETVSRAKDEERTEVHERKQRESESGQYSGSPGGGSSSRYTPEGSFPKAGDQGMAQAGKCWV